MGGIHSPRNRAGARRPVRGTASSYTPGLGWIGSSEGAVLQGSASGRTSSCKLLRSVLRRPGEGSAVPPGSHRTGPAALRRTRFTTSNQVVVDASTEPHGFDDGRKIIIEEHETSRFAGHIGSAPPIAIPICVHSIARHGDDVIVRLQRVDDAQLLLRNHASEDLHHIPSRDAPTFAVTNHEGARARGDRAAPRARAPCDAPGRS